MGDLFHEDVPFEFINSVMARMVYIWRHTYLLLTKRPARMKQYFAYYVSERRKRVPSTVGAGTTCENQERARERIPYLVAMPLAVKFISAEPLLGSIDLYAALGLRRNENGAHALGRTLDWVIAGAETGPGARPAELDWFRRLRDDCLRAGIPFFLKKVNAEGETKLDGQEHRQWPRRAITSHVDCRCGPVPPLPGATHGQ